MAVSLDNIALNDLVSDSISKLRAKTNFTSFSAGAKARSLLEIIQDTYMTQIGRIQSSQVVNLLSSAIGDYLDYLGDIVGCPRLNPTTSAISEGHQIIKLYVTSGTFGDINSGNNIILPSGTTAYALASNQKPIYYETTEPYVLDASLSEQYIGMRAINSGTISNLDIDQLTSIDFTNYTDYKNATLLITNESPITFGLDNETDDNYRFRISNQITALATANEVAVRLAILQVPGVAECKIIAFDNGVGTATAIVQSVTPSTPDVLIDLVESIVGDVRALGIMVYVEKPSETGAQFELTVKYTEEVSTADIVQIEQNISIAITDYVNNLGIGKALVINELVQRVMDVDDRILDIGSPNNPFDNVYLYKYSKVNSSRVRRRIQWNYQPAQYEKVILEQTIPDAIIIHSL